MAVKIERFVFTLATESFFPIRVWFRNKTFGSETVCRLSWKKDKWKTENTILFP